MSAELVLLRHAHAERDSATGLDFDRPLSALGGRQAEAAAEHLYAAGVGFDRVLCSPARRTVETLDRLAARFGELPIRMEQAIYEATAGELIGVLEPELGADRRVLLIGHNPALEQLLALLTDGRATSFRGMPTAAVARLALAPEGLEPGGARLMEFWSP